MKTAITILIVDDQIVVRAGFSSVLRTHVDLNVLGSISNGQEAISLMARFPVEVLLLDLHMPGMGGVETLLALQKLAHPPSTIVLSSFEPDEEIMRAVEAGAQGYLRKDTSCSDIIEAIYAVHSGGTYLPAWIKSRSPQRRFRSCLSPRELEILEMVAKGLTNKEIGRVIRLSPFTVRNHVRHIMAKLEAGDRTEAATVAIREGILTNQHSSDYAGPKHTSEDSAKLDHPPWANARSGFKGAVRSVIEN